MASSLGKMPTTSVRRSGARPATAAVVRD